MSRQQDNLFSRPGWLVIWLAACLGVRGTTVADLRTQLAAGGKLTVIDVRSPELFSQGHIPGAINIPASLCAQKNLPALGRVVVCDAGLGRDNAAAAASALAAKPGLSVEVLDGGFAAWESAQGPTTKPLGMKAESLNYIAYGDLKAAKTSEVVLVDLREPVSPPNAQAKSSRTATPTDLTLEFPGMRVTHSPFANLEGPQISVSRSTPSPLLVLIDNGDGKAEAMARTLKANGVRRYVILAGGEAILSRKGRPGLERTGIGSRSPNQTPAAGGAR